MDEIDFTICLMLMWNSRIAYRELAEKFNMSVNSIHKRIRAMVKLGTIDKFVTNLSLNAFKPNPSNVVMYGKSNAKNAKDVIYKLGSQENIYNVSQQSGNLFFIHAFLRNLNELDPLVSFIRQTGEILELKVGLDSAPIHQDRAPVVSREIKLSKLDFLIINALKNNSRKSIGDVADEVGSSTKTVRRHLNHLVEETLVSFSIHWYPDKCSEVIAMIILKIIPRTDANKVKIMEELQKKYQKILFIWSFSTLPDTLIICVWTSTMKELQRMEASLMSENFESVMVNIGLEGKIFPTWRDKYLEDKIKEIEENLA